MELFFSSKELELIRKNLNEPTIQVFLKQEFGSQQSDHREKIKLELKEITYTDSSISHCERLGGFATLNNNQNKIGLDVEEIARVKAQIVRRICKTQTEFEGAPAADYLWAAKESAFKALKGSSQPKVISEIVITGWSKIENEFWIFSVANFENLKGIALRKGPFVAALSLKH